MGFYKKKLIYVCLYRLILITSNIAHMVSFWKSSLLDNVLRSSLDLSSLLHSILGKKIMKHVRIPPKIKNILVILLQMQKTTLTIVLGNTKVDRKRKCYFILNFVYNKSIVYRSMYSFYYPSWAKYFHYVFILLSFLGKIFSFII